LLSELKAIYETKTFKLRKIIIERLM